MNSLRVFALVASFAFIGASAVAQEDVEAIYQRYHSAIHAAVLCEDRVLEQQGVDDPNADVAQDAQARMGAVINGKINHEISAGRRLSLIETAKAETDALVQSEGCDGTSVQELLALFHADLEPALP